MLSLAAGRVLPLVSAGFAFFTGLNNSTMRFGRFLTRSSNVGQRSSETDLVDTQVTKGCKDFVLPLPLIQVPSVVGSGGRLSAVILYMAGEVG